MSSGAARVRVCEAASRPPIDALHVWGMALRLEEKNSQAKGCTGARRAGAEVLDLPACRLAMRPVACSPQPAFRSTMFI